MHSDCIYQCQAMKPRVARTPTWGTQFWEKSTFFYLKVDLVHSWVRPVHWRAQNWNPTTFENHVFLNWMSGFKHASRNRKKLSGWIFDFLGSLKPPRQSAQDGPIKVFWVHGASKPRFHRLALMPCMHHVHAYVCTYKQTHVLHMCTINSMHTVSCTCAHIHCDTHDIVYTCIHNVMHIHVQEHWCLTY